MFLQDHSIPIGLKSSSTNYKTFYNYRVNQLLEYMMKLFSYKNVPETIPAHEIDLYLFLYGHCGIVKGTKTGNIIAVVPQLSGPTDYLDIYKKFTWATPIESGQCYIDKNGILIDNTMLHNSSYPLIHTTAARLAHIDVTMICTLVNARDTVAIKAISSKFAHDAESYQRQKYNGSPSFIVDRGFSTIDFEDCKTDRSFNVRELADTSQQILSEFYENIGINKTVNKRERLITAEADNNKQLLKLNIMNMFESRKEGIRKVNAMFGTDITVECNVDISNYSMKDPEAVPAEGSADEVKEGEADAEAT